MVCKELDRQPGETLGTIEDLVVDPANGTVDFAIVSRGGIGLRDRFMAVPWNALGVIPGRDYVLLDIDKNVLDRTPLFTRDEWPDFGDPGWRSRAYAHYGYSDRVSVHERPVVVHKDYRTPPRKDMSVGAAVVLVLILVALMGFTYIVSTRGWQQTRTDLINSVSGVTYAMKDTSADAALTAKVKTSLTLNKRVPAGSIDVDSENGVVTLRGDVNDEQTRDLVGKIAEDTPGVQQVRNHLYVTSTGK
jgi:sporulation protein YlmC with PRC-barrel domain